MSNVTYNKNGRFFIPIFYRRQSAMDTKYLVFSSVTYALRALSLLSQNSVYARLEKIKNLRAVGGCGYALAVKSADLDAASNIITSSGIRIIDVLDDKNEGV